MTTKVTVLNTKGGVGKTTLVANLSGLLVDLGNNVLMVDADTGQPGLSSYFPIEKLAPKGITDLFMSAPSTLNLSDFISKTTIPNLDFIYSDDVNDELKGWVKDQPDGSMRLKTLLNCFDHLYDFIIIDTQGSKGTVQDAAAIAADILVCPIPLEILAAKELERGTFDMLDRLRPMAAYGFPLGKLYGVLNKQDRTVDARLILQGLKEKYDIDSENRITLCQTIIPSSVNYRSGASRQMPVHLLEPGVKDTMLSLTREIFPNTADFSRSTSAADTSIHVS